MEGLDARVNEMQSRSEGRMIKTIIKRDGSKQAYQASKLNKWGEWAAKKTTVDWSSIVIKAVNGLSEEVRSEDLQNALIRECLNKKSWSYYLMAGRLYAVLLQKGIHVNGRMPTVKMVQERLVKDGLMRQLDYSERDYEAIETFIRHDLDYETPHFSLEHIRRKYSLQNRVTGKEYETQQFVYMRMAMALAEYEEKEHRLEHVKNYYYLFSNKILSAPTPNYVNLGTSLQSYASCCLYDVKDTIDSLVTGDVIAYKMTAASAGIGNVIRTRSVGDPVRDGLIEHKGKLGYYASLGKAVKANLQNGRGGAATTYYSAFDPEGLTINQLRNPRSVEDKKNRDIHYALQTNHFFSQKVAKNEDVFLFNTYTAPDLHEAFYAGDSKRFETLYQAYEANPTFKKTYINARDFLIQYYSEVLETGTMYKMDMDNTNNHTSFKDPIKSSNLCLEITQPTEAYNEVFELNESEDVGFAVFKYLDKEKVEAEMTLPYSTSVTVIDEVGKETRKAIYELKSKDRFFIDQFNPKFDRGFIDSPVEFVAFIEIKKEPEISLCNLAALAIENIKDDEKYALAAYYALRMIDYCIENTKYVFKHLGFTAKNRRNAGVGIMGLATVLASKKLSYSSLEGKNEIHRIAERHAYFLIKASLELSKEFGVANWTHRTKWSDGWLPIDTYNRKVDKVHTETLRYDWEALRKAIVENGGIRHSSLVSYMPGEASSKAVGTTNSVYPVRATTLNKTDNSIAIRWSAPYADDPNYQYTNAWDLPTKDLIECYAIIQKFTDQAISADLYKRISNDSKLSGMDLVKEDLYMTSLGVKTRYYVNSHTSDSANLEEVKKVIPTPLNSTPVVEDEYCESCAL